MGHMSKGLFLGKDQVYCISGVLNGFNGTHLLSHGKYRRREEQSPHDSTRYGRCMKVVVGFRKKDYLGNGNPLYACH